MEDMIHMIMNNLEHVCCDLVICVTPSNSSRHPEKRWLVKLGLEMSGSL